MFFGFANFYKWFIKSFSIIIAPLISILIITIQSALGRLSQFMPNKNEPNTNSSSSVGSGWINDKIANVSSSIKKINSGVGFLIFKASLAFIQSSKSSKAFS